MVIGLGLAQKVAFRPCREAEQKKLQQLDDFLGKAIGLNEYSLTFSLSLFRCATILLIRR